MGGLSSIPPGVFKALLDLWAIVRVTYAGIFELFSTVLVFDLSILGLGTFSVIQLAFGTGLVFYVQSHIAKWVLSLFGIK